MEAKLNAAAIAEAAHVIAGRDPILADVLERLGPPPIWKRPATLATLVRIILEQQVSLASAKATFDRIVIACEGRVSAEAIRGVGEDHLKTLGLSRQKARYTIALADDVLAKRFRIGSLRHLGDDDVRAAITARLGLGNWSADVFLMMALGRRDVLPVGDLALVKGLGELDGTVFETQAAVIERAEVWRPFRSVGTRMVWQNYLNRRNTAIP